MFQCLRVMVVLTQHPSTLNDSQTGFASKCNCNVRFNCVANFNSWGQHVQDLQQVDHEKWMKSMDNKQQSMHPNLLLVRQAGFEPTFLYIPGDICEGGGCKNQSDNTGLEVALAAQLKSKGLERELPTKSLTTRWTINCHPRSGGRLSSDG
ncbi:hypothetical protein B0H17DRAFT_1134444 [Mycena rosella]|uniref:Uncharacterized protein n=1 Tax=Mycena rosella TaxID=1033263 RepID=A0AAD7GH01_MYCRO|nr:hypothetical protein B0H17DRAFT_1134444 [Mycena rosella]